MSASEHQQRDSAPRADQRELAGTSVLDASLDSAMRAASALYPHASNITIAIEVDRPHSPATSTTAAPGPRRRTRPPRIRDPFTGQFLGADVIAEAAA
jgi:hypothetical protein